MRRTALLIALNTLLLTGCLSISTTEAPTLPDVTANACQGRERPCRELCGNAEVQSFTCNARAGVSFDYRCECRRATPL